MDRILKFFKENPWIGLIVTVFALIGTPFSIYSYFKSTKTTELSCYIHSTVAPIYNSSIYKDIKVMKNDRVISGNIYSTLISIWNNGENPITHAGILEPLTMKSGNGNKILDARIISSSREIITPSITNSPDYNDGLTIDWKILEKGDSLLVQIIYEGLDKPDLTITASMIGQKTISKIALNSNYTKDKYLNIVQLLTLTLPSVMVPIMTYRKKKKGLKPHWLEYVISILLPIAMIAAIIIVSINIFTSANVPYI